MLESINDWLSILVTIGFIFCGIYILFVVNDRHHDEDLRKREELFYTLYEDLSEEEDDTSTYYD